MSCLNVTVPDSSQTDKSSDSADKRISTHVLRGSAQKLRKVRFSSLESPGAEACTDADISTDLDDSILSQSNAIGHCEYLAALSTTAFSTSPSPRRNIFKASFPLSSALPPMKKRRIDMMTVVYPFFGDNAKITKLTALRILEYLDNKDLFAVSLVNVLLHSAALDDALWE